MTPPSTRPKHSLAVASGLFVFTLLLRGARLGQPSTFVFDEIFYVNDALDLVTRGAERTFAGHPPLAKWLIGLPMLVGGFSPSVWRASVLVAGAAVVALVYIATATLTRSSWAGLAASTLVLTDGVSHFAGRYAILDGFTALFATAALTYLIATGDRRTGYPSALIVGALCGAALATKWTAFPILVLGVVICMLRCRAYGVGRALAVAAAAIVTAIIVYIGAFTPWIIGGASYGNCTVPACSSGPLERLVRLPAMQVEMLRSGAGARASSHSQRATDWWLQKDALKIVVYQCNAASDRSCEPDTTRTMHLRVQGNRLLWALAPVLAIVWFWRRRALGETTMSGIALAFAWAAALWLPWLLTSRAYVFYAAPIVPALAIGAMSAIWDIFDRRYRATVVTITAAIGVVMFVLRPAAPWVR